MHTSSKTKKTGKRVKVTGSGDCFRLQRLTKSHRVLFSGTEACKKRAIPGAVAEHSPRWTASYQTMRSVHCVWLHLRNMQIRWSYLSVRRRHDCIGMALVKLCWNRIVGPSLVGCRHGLMYQNDVAVFSFLPYVAGSIAYREIRGGFIGTISNLMF